MPKFVWEICLQDSDYSRYTQTHIVETEEKAVELLQRYMDETAARYDVHWFEIKPQGDRRTWNYRPNYTDFRNRLANPVPNGEYITCEKKAMVESYEELMSLER